MWAGLKTDADEIASTDETAAAATITAGLIVAAAAAAVVVVVAISGVVKAKTLCNKTFQLFRALTMKSEDREAVISLRLSRLAMFARHC